MARGLKLTLCNVGRITDHGVQAVVRRISSLKILEVPTMYLYSTRAACRRLRTGHIGLAHRHAAAAPAVAVLLVPFLSSAMQFRSAAAPVTPPLAQPRSPRGGGGASESRGNGGRRSVRCAFAASWERRRPRGRAFHPIPAARRRRDRSASRRCSNVVHNYIQLYCIIQLHYISCYITNYTTANAQAEASGVSERVASLLETGKFKMLLLDGFVRDDP